MTFTKLPVYIYFGFPLTKPSLLNKWVQALRREGFVHTKFLYVCSDKFEVNDFQVRPGAKYNLLKGDAVPSIFDFPNHLKVCCNCSLVKTFN